MTGYLIALVIFSSATTGTIAEARHLRPVFGWFVAGALLPVVAIAAACVWSPPPKR